MTITAEMQAKLLESMQEVFGDGEGGWKKSQEALKTLRKEMDALNEINIKEVFESYEKLKAQQKQLENAIRNKRDAYYISGLEDQQEFSVVKTLVAVRTGNWDKAGYEKELLDQVREKRREVFKGMNIHDDSLAGPFIPDQVIPDVIAAIYKRSAFFALDGEGETRVSIMEGLTAGSVKVPKFLGGLIAYWIGDEDEYTESMMEAGDLTMNPKKMGVLVRLTDSMKRFPGMGFEKLMRKDMEKAAATKFDWTIAYGSGTDNTPLGLAGRPGIKVYSAEANVEAANNVAALTALNSGDWQGAEFSFDQMEEMRLLMEEDDVVIDDMDWATVSSPRLYSKMRRMKIENYSGQTSGQPYLLGAPMIPEARLRDLIGDFGKTTQIPTRNKPGASVGAPSATGTQTCSDVFAGDLSQCVVGRWSGIEIEDDEGKGKGFTSDHTYVKLRMYADIGVRQERAMRICPDAKVR